MDVKPLSRKGAMALCGKYNIDNDTANDILDSSRSYMSEYLLKRCEEMYPSEKNFDRVTHTLTLALTHSHYHSHTHTGTHTLTLALTHSHYHSHPFLVSLCKLSHTATR